MKAKSWGQREKTKTNGMGVGGIDIAVILNREEVSTVSCNNRSRVEKERKVVI